MSVCPKCQELQPFGRLRCSECGTWLMFDTAGRVDHAAWLAARRGDAA